MPRRYREQGKRQWVDEDGEEDTVDDLAHAATFAMMTMIPNPTNAMNSYNGGTISNSHTDQVMTPIDTSEDNNKDNDDIELDESSSDDGDDGVAKEGEQSENKNDQVVDDDEEDDDEEEESEVDLVEELAKMEDDEAFDDDDDDDDNGNGEDNNPANKIPRPPKTENELDAYRTPIQELEKHLQVQLTVTPDESTGITKNRHLSHSDLQTAGRIKHYMALDRTVVVESSVDNPHGDMSSFKHHNAPLDEGTLLFVRLSHPNEPGASTADEELIPLGRIFEVFGPVSKPLYTIRLPTKPTMKSRPKAVSPRITKAAESCKAKVVSSPSVEDERVESEPITNQNNGKTTEDSSECIQEPSAQDATNEGSTLSEEQGMPQSADNKEDPTTSHPTKDTAICKENAEEIQDEDDDWGPEGKYAKLLQQNTSTPVYYVKNEAKLIDTGFILKLSGKGCDASNLYDEEVVNTNEMYYSDDEEERQAKNRRKNKVPPHQQQHEGGMSRKPPMDNQHSLPSGFHHAASSSNQRSSSVHQTMPLPPGFYPAQPLPPHGRRYDASAPSYPVVSRGVRGPPPPPPPASGGMNPPPAYQY